MARPYFTHMVKAFAQVKERDPKSVGMLIGGMVRVNFDSGDWKNACAVRMSYALNQSGCPIPFTEGQTVSGENPTRAWYMFRVSFAMAYLRLNWGEPDVVTSLINGSHRSQLEGMKGLLGLNVPQWNDATGHLTLWDGVGVLESHDYLPQAKNAYLWELP